VSFTTVTPVSATALTVTPVVPVKLVPRSTTAVLAVFCPWSGATSSTVGAPATYTVYLTVLPALVPFEVVTMTSCFPTATLPGTVAVMVVSFTTVMPVSVTPPTVTAVAPVRSPPVMVTVRGVPARPAIGSMSVTTGDFL
jgi:hypothetical protein